MFAFPVGFPFGPPLGIFSTFLLFLVRVTLEIILSTFSSPFKNLQKLIKSDVSDMNGPRKHVCRVENMLIDPGDTNFRCTVTNFMKKEKKNFLFLPRNSHTTLTQRQQCLEMERK